MPERLLQHLGDDELHSHAMIPNAQQRMTGTLARAEPQEKQEIQHHARELLQA